MAHSDEAQDKALMSKMVKSSALKHGMSGMGKKAMPKKGGTHGLARTKSKGK